MCSAKACWSARSAERVAATPYPQDSDASISLGEGLAADRRALWKYSPGPRPIAIIPAGSKSLARYWYAGLFPYPLHPNAEKQDSCIDICALTREFDPPRRDFGEARGYKGSTSPSREITDTVAHQIAVALFDDISGDSITRLIRMANSRPDSRYAAYGRRTIVFDPTSDIGHE
jgi:hypothetical protein